MVLKNLQKSTRNGLNNTVGQLPFKPTDYSDKKDVGLLTTSPGYKNRTKAKKETPGIGKKL